MLIAIDHGNYAIKTPHTAFLSGLAEHKVQPPLAEEVVEYGGSYWTLSGKRLPYMRGQDPGQPVLCPHPVRHWQGIGASGLPASFEQIDLAVGLPPEHYGMLRDKFAQYFRRGVVKFTYKEQPIHLDIRRVLVYPQAYAAVIPQSGQLLKTSRVFIVDIGGFTTDVLLLRNGKPDLQFCRSLESGVITMDNEIIGKINAQYDRMVDDELISDVLLGRETILPQEFKQTIQRRRRLTPRTSWTSCGSWEWTCAPIPPFSSAEVAACSGPCWRDSPMVAKADFVEDPKANAIGYEMLAAHQLRS